MIRPLPLALLVALRPAQWTKNLALFIAPAFAFKLGDPHELLHVAIAIAAFSLLASAVYLLNDVRDRAEDRLHPEKRHRPIAAGELPVGAAIGCAAVLLLGAGLLAHHHVNAAFASTLGAYLWLQLLYTLWLKHEVILDVFAIAAGFVLRVVAGAEAVDVPVSGWLYLCTLFAALFLALGKRRAELVLLGDDAGRHRENLAHYSLPLLDQLLTLTASASVLAFALYTAAPETTARFGNDRLRLTVPVALFGLFRYLYLLHQRGEGGRPERVLLRDRPTQVAVLLLAALVAWAISGARAG